MRTSSRVVARRRARSRNVLSEGALQPPPTSSDSSSSSQLVAASGTGSCTDCWGICWGREACCCGCKGRVRREPLLFLIALAVPSNTPSTCSGGSAVLRFPRPLSARRIALVHVDASAWETIHRGDRVGEREHRVVLERRSVVGVAHESLRNLRRDAGASQASTERRTQAVEVCNAPALVDELDAGALEVELAREVRDLGREDAIGWRSDAQPRPSSASRARRDPKSGIARSTVLQNLGVCLGSTRCANSCTIT